MVKNIKNKIVGNSGPTVKV